MRALKEAKLERKENGDWGPMSGYTWHQCLQLAKENYYAMVKKARDPEVMPATWTSAVWEAFVYFGPHPEGKKLFQFNATSSTRKRGQERGRNDAIEDEDEDARGNSSRASARARHAADIAAQRRGETPALTASDRRVQAAASAQALNSAAGDHATALRIQVRRCKLDPKRVDPRLKAPGFKI